MPTPNPYLEEMVKDHPLNQPRTKPRTNQEALKVVRLAMEELRHLQSGAWCSQAGKLMHALIKVAMTALLHLEEECKRRHYAEMEADFSPTE